MYKEGYIPINALQISTLTKQVFWFHTRRVWYIQGWVEQGSDEPDLAEDVLAFGRGLDQMTFKGHFQPEVLCDSFILVL